ncbi:betaine--homocysteine S-methyltransferase 1-like [Babylonia areolata]|uniref:betaine--homocysteine S-methyltransferase 1-like n=1 Tax=Babylonia areolata TaxID=304850 RepID=UPI003FD61DB7
MPVKGLRERLRDGESIVCAEGYLIELERRGYVSSGPFIPEVVLDYPEHVTSLHQEFVHAGSDVVEAFTYFAHREKLQSAGLEEDLEQLNLTALRLAREVADSTGTLMAASITKSTIYDPECPSLNAKIRDMFKEQVEWAVQGKADYIVLETFYDLGETKLAMEVVQQYGQGLPIAVTMGPFMTDMTLDDVPIPQALRQLEEMGADVVGLNCGRGPSTMLPLLRQCRQVCKGPLAALPVAYRTTDEEKTYQSMTDPFTGKNAFPLNLSSRLCSREEIRAFAQEAKTMGVQYIGLCCGNNAVLNREIAQVYGKSPPSLKYAPDVRQSLAADDDSMTPRKRKVKMFLAGGRDVK